ncbi:MAG: ADP-ribosylglycohydrolase family protein [Anaerolineaceae bacterium]|nr:MAG: ADP-ribosylglycohydrolase family protein [Anaerolineaceae bacterium]
MKKMDYINKLYAGFLGMNIGIRLGAPVEPVAWDFDRIASVYGDINGYLKNFKNFAADDDVNGPVYFLRGLTDNGVNNEMTPDAIGKAWLNYTRNGIGMFWWGGNGVSTEHTAYDNLKKGIIAPESGSIKQNGIILAEQIGGQIFIDTWGFIWPGNPAKAAEYAMKAASVSHDGNGLYGAAFMAACIAQAFIATSMDEVIDTGLAHIPRDSTYAKVVMAVREFHKVHPQDFRACMRYLIENWGYDKYGGVCHIIPNAGVCVLSLLYGQGNFNRIVEIASMCGWDTDCNAGNVGSIAGVLYNLSGIRKDYIDPINDVIITSGISGYLNILDIPTYIKEMAAIAYELRGEAYPEDIKRPGNGDILFDFELPGSTHGIRLSNEIRFMKRHSKERAYKSKGSLEIILDRILPEDQCRVYYKPFYRRDDFNDERYKPVFSPTVNCNQKVSYQLYLELWLEGEIIIKPYIRTAMRDRYLFADDIKLIAGQWNSVEFVVPDTDGDQIAELGFLIKTSEDTKSRVFGRLFLDDFTVTGDSKYAIDMSIQTEEFAQITPFSLNQCKGELKNGMLYIHSEGEGQIFTGNYYAKDIIVEALLTPVSGEHKGIILRGQGAERGYLLGFGKQGEVEICCKNYGTTVLAKAKYDWQWDVEYKLKTVVSGSNLTLYIDGKEVLSVKDHTFDYGMIGLYQEMKGTIISKSINVLTS